ncbi:unnamed protein product [Cuscuta campestris]|uniref:Uncharacterized protein n=2 Tax=Cuscuta sect. Cleistogrammica TaxID=1824901 RepID=A0A484NJG0_9ASTE|nr:hypothetical protein DM860_004892 [Cuscuta australis]VFQ99954.1 unnamed protein product [Cuscuta campestris]
MEALLSPFKSSGGRIRMAWRRRTYRRVDGARKKNLRVTRFGSRPPRLQWRRLLSPPVRLWTRLKMMLSFAGGSQLSRRERLTGGNKADRRSSKIGYTKTEFENRLIYEIYKSVVPSMELYPNKPMSP